MDSFESFIASEVATSKKARILTVSHQIPDALYGFEGELVYIGYLRPTKNLTSSNYSIRVVDTEAGVLAAVRGMALHRLAIFDVIILDTNHTAATLAAQVNAVQSVRAPETVFLFPGAAPPRRSVGTPKPTEAWWTGDVWTLPVILEKAGASCLVSGAAPIGFLVATGVSALDVSEVIAEASRIQSSVPDDVALGEFIRPASNSRIVESISKALGRLLDKKYLRVIVDPAEPDVRSSQVVDAFRSWTRPSPAFVIDLSDERMDFDRLYKTERSVQGVTLDQFGACHVLGRDVILCGYGQGPSVNCYGRNVYPEVTRANLRLLADEEPIEGDRATLMEAREGALCFPRTLLEEAEPLDQPVFLGTPDEHRNYGMWLLYSVPGAKLFQTVKGDYPRFLAFQGSPWQASMLIELGVKPEELVRQRGGCSYRCEGLAIMRQSYRSLALSAGDLEAFDEFGERAVHGQAAGPERIFVSRLSHTRAGGYRGLQNEQSLIDRLLELDFAVVEPESLSLNQQARMFRNANVIVGLGGAAMFNVAFSRAGVKVVDIESGMLHADAHASLFASRGAHYGVIFGQTDRDDSRPVHRRWSIDVDATLAAIKAFI